MPWVTPQIFIAEAVFHRQYLEAQARVRALEKAERERQSAHIDKLVQEARAARNVSAEDIEFREVQMFMPPPMLAAPELPNA